MHIYIINGSPQTGKSSFCEMVKTYTGDEWCLNISTVDFVKEVAAYCGWDGVKDAKSRKFLSDLKDALTEWGDVPVKKIKLQVEHFKRGFEIFNVDSSGAVVFIHCREPHEIKRLCDELNAKSILVRRAEAESVETSNHADAEVFNYIYDIEVNNNGSLIELNDFAKDFVEFENLHNLKF